MKSEKKSDLRNFTLCAEADAELVRRKHSTGKTMTAVLEDLLLGRRLFSPTVETFIENEATRTGATRWQIVSAAVEHGIKSRASYPNPRSEYSFTADRPSSRDSSADHPVVAVVKSYGKLRKV